MQWDWIVVDEKCDNKSMSPDIIFQFVQLLAITSELFKMSLREENLGPYLLSP